MDWLKTRIRELGTMDERDEILAVKLPCKKKNPNNQQTINADVDSSQRGAAGRWRGSERVDVNKMSSAIQPPALKTSVKTSYFRSGN